MTRHAPQHANGVTRKSNHSLNSNRLRNPWLLDQQQQYAGTIVSSSNSSQERAPTYCTLSGPGPPSIFPDSVSEQRLKCYPMPSQSSANKSMTMPRLKSHKSYASYVERASSLARTNPTSVSAAPKGYPHPLYYPRGAKLSDHASVVNGGCNMSGTSSDRPVTPISLSTTDGIVDPCGGYCKTFERCCHYLLQVIFIIGILLGVSLVLAAYWLHNQRRGGDQLVLVYIGVLMAMVCTLLLSIQCSVEREVKRKKRNRRATAALLARNRSHAEVPMQDLGGSNAIRFGFNSREAEDAVPAVNAFCHVPLLYSPYQYESQSRSCDEMSQSQNGIPWWRRHEMEVTSKDNIV